MNKKMPMHGAFCGCSSFYMRIILSCKNFEKGASSWLSVLPPTKCNCGSAITANHAMIDNAPIQDQRSKENIHVVETEEEVKGHVAKQPLRLLLRISCQVLIIKKKNLEELERCRLTGKKWKHYWTMKCSHGSLCWRASYHGNYSQCINSPSTWFVCSWYKGRCSTHTDCVTVGTRVGAVPILTVWQLVQG